VKKIERQSRELQKCKEDFIRVPVLVYYDRLLRNRNAIPRSQAVSISFTVKGIPGGNCRFQFLLLLHVGGESTTLLTSFVF
jgi:hypothetical protein